MRAAQRWPMGTSPRRLRSHAIEEILHMVAVGFPDACTTVGGGAGEAGGRLLSIVSRARDPQPSFGPQNSIPSPETLGASVASNVAVNCDVLRAAR